ncbi:DNA-binding response OmpR family regulator [Friedmanniella endophytica]|uniref:DNA-binding response OmpR family regulator n=1 Tax=Microlunatus kandeliicorticis TaxID=1759536 RepID=A0A7W3P5U8_9ACTN|nr:response regulator [Microlunatus kandeliicorticis]MBA8794371.1 DNA-binding response OmpR family regulator [Microlunatus kandeliicorticis]
MSEQTGQTGQAEHAEESGGAPAQPAGPTETLKVLLYSDDRTVRTEVRLALGRRVARDLPEIEVLEVATQPAVVRTLDQPGIDLVILDGEAAPGGMGICRQLKDEIWECPPVLVLTGRPDDAWLATWSRADAAVPHPIDPIRLPAAVAALLRSGRTAAVSGG